MPLVCLAFNPGLVHGGADLADPPPHGERPSLMLHNYPSTPYAAFLVQMLAIVVWLCGGATRPTAAAVLSAVFAVGAALVLGIGLSFLPISLVCIVLMGIGLLGFTPLFTAWTYFEQQRVAWKLAAS